jgi:hypothetical protein
MIESATHHSEATQTRTYSTYGMFYSDTAQRDTLYCDRIVRPVFSELWKLYDRYIEHARDVPWWHTERSIVGHLTAAAFNAGHVAIEEYSSDRAPTRDGDPRRQGRVDWWVGTPHYKDRFIAETKAIWLAKNPRSWDHLDATLESAREQVSGYKDPDCEHRLAMCFARPYWQVNGKGENTAERERWLRQEKPDGAAYDYCAYYWLNDEHLERCCIEGWPNLSPALLVYCKEITLASNR